MSRECHRVLRRGGHVATIAIEAGPGLSEAELEEAAELGPSEVRSEAPLADLTEKAGFEVVDVRDLTQEYRRVVVALRQELAAHEAELRAAEGDDEYDYEVQKRTSMLAAIDRGLIRRTMVVAAR